MSTADKSNDGSLAALPQRLKEDLKAALRSKDNTRRDTIRQIMAEYPKLTVPITLQSGKKTTRLKQSSEISDDDIIAIVGSLVKSEQIVLEMTGRDSSPYLEILREYMPEMADEQTVITWIKENVDFSQYANKMQAMGTIMKHFGKTVDGKLVNAILKDRL